MPTKRETTVRKRIIELGKTAEREKTPVRAAMSAANGLLALIAVELAVMNDINLARLEDVEPKVTATLPARIKLPANIMKMVGPPPGKRLRG